MKKRQTQTNNHVSPHQKQKLHKQQLAERRARLFAWGMFAVLMVSSAYWALLGAHYHLQNADQLVNALLFDGSGGLHNALLPNAHSFLLKWPLFWLAAQLGLTKGVLIWLTIAVVLVTVAGLAYLLHRIEKRPYVLGVVYLALASMLLLVPIAPYSGALLPVNMAMLATRNIEYIVYIFGLYLVYRGRHFWRWHSARSIPHVRHTGRMAVGGVVVFALLFATDKLFVTLSLGGALGFLALYGVARQRHIVRIGIAWLCSSIVAVILALLTLTLLSAFGITNIVAGGSGLSPYSVVTNIHDIGLGLFNAVFAFAAHFGADFVGDSRLIREMPAHAANHLASAAGIGFLVNLFLLGISLYLAITCIVFTVRSKVQHDAMLRFPPVLAGMLFTSSLVALAAFVGTKHYYPVDARYLTISFFAVVVAATVALGLRQPSKRWLIVTGVFASVSIIASSAAIGAQHKAYMAPLQPYADNNAKIAKVVHEHKVKYLVGDYWRVVPIAYEYGMPPTPVPMGNCTQYSQTLTSLGWQPHLRKNEHYAVLVSQEKGLTGYPGCTIEQIIQTFGEPSNRVIIEGSQVNPKEVVLLYGPHPTAKKIEPKTCTNTVMNVVAHEDDDLLFINPNTADSLAAGDCVRTVYMTAGDSGQGLLYWEGRERGSMAAYSYMTGVPEGYWTEQSVKLDKGVFATVATLQSKVTLLFLRLPDGGVRGGGFQGTGYRNMSRLRAGAVDSVQSVDRRTTLTSDQLNALLVKLMDTYKPNTVRTQNPTDGAVFADHSDHKATSQYTQSAYEQYAQHAAAEGRTTAIQHYVGYQVREQPQNVFPPALDAKVAAFMEYAKQDGAVCNTIQACATDGTYSEYLPRQYWW